MNNKKEKISLLNQFLKEKGEKIKPSISLLSKPKKFTSENTIGEIPKIISKESENSDRKENTTEKKKKETFTFKKENLDILNLKNDIKDLKNNLKSLSRQNPVTVKSILESPPRIIEKHHIKNSSILTNKQFISKFFNNNSTIEIKQNKISEDSLSKVNEIEPKEQNSSKPDNNLQTKISPIDFDVARPVKKGKPIQIETKQKKPSFNLVPEKVKEVVKLKEIEKTLREQFSKKLSIPKYKLDTTEIKKLKPKKLFNLLENQNYKIPSFASGGIVTDGPKVVIAGDNPSGKEAIVPLENQPNKQNLGMTDGNSNFSGSLSSPLSVSPSIGNEETKKSISSMRTGMNLKAGHNELSPIGKMANDNSIPKIARKEMEQNSYEKSTQTAQMSASSASSPVVVPSGGGGGGGRQQSSGFPYASPRRQARNIESHQQSKMEKIYPFVLPKHRTRIG